MTKQERIELAKKNKGSRTDRKLRKYSDNFNTIFSFYLKLVRSGLVTFCGSDIQLEYNKNGEEAKYVFREYDNGRYKNSIPTTKHPNLLKAIILGKKGWGLWVKLWSEGIADGTLLRAELEEEFKVKGIVLPTSMENELNNSIYNARIKKIYR